jgi:hypothetical protein
MMVMHLAVRLRLPAKWKKERHQAGPTEQWPTCNSSRISIGRT